VGCSFFALICGEVEFDDVIPEYLAKKIQSQRFWSIVLSILSVILMLTCLLAPLGLERYLNTVIHSLVVVNSNESAAFHSWENGNNTFMSFYLYNYTNPVALVAGKEKPNMVEVGPFTYIAHQYRFDVRFDSAHGTVQYKQRNWYEFQPDKSAGLLDTTPITTVNIVFQAILTFGQSAGYLNLLMAEIFKNTPIQPHDDGTECVLVHSFINSFKNKKIPCGGLFTTRMAKEHLFGYSRTRS
jgi:hypothetical protein